MRKFVVSGLLMRIGGGAAALGLIAVAVPTLATALAQSESPGGQAPAAGPWVCEAIQVASAPGPVYEPASARLIAGLVLSAQETALGIRSDQMDAWRGYTQALIALVPGGERLGRWTDEKKRAEAQAFDLAQDIASAAAERAEKARALQDAITRLKSVLTAEQMNMARQMQQKLVERVLRFVEWRRGENAGLPL